jgi:hypothetical protein
MNISGDAKLIAQAFIKARGEMSATVAKDAKGNYGKYATLAAIVEATAGAFANNGLAIVQETGTDEQGVTVETWLIHESGATIHFGSLSMPLGDRKPQAVGSAITYGRRYALAAICGLAPDDDDGQAAQDATPRQQQATRPQNTQKAQQATTAPKRTVDASTGEILEPNGAVPTDAELEILGKWATPDDAFAWAVENKACNALEHAKNSLKALITEQFDGKFNTKNAAAVYLALLRHWSAKVPA